MLAAVAGPGSPRGAAAQPGHERVIVQAGPGGIGQARAAVRSVGGRPIRDLPIVDGFLAQIPASRLRSLARRRGVVRVTRDRHLSPQNFLAGTTYDQGDVASSMMSATQLVGASDYWSHDLTGAGVDVAIIDTGVTRVPGLDGAGKVIDGPDLSFESQNPGRRYLDGYGHGTHLAGIVAGTDWIDVGDRNDTGFVGVAPGARVLNMKVGDSNGVADVSQVIAAIDWVVAHRRSHGLNVRVLLLAYGTDSTQDFSESPLAHALESAWRAGIFVVVAAGNNGTDPTGRSNRLNSPADDPLVMTVGASHPGVKRDSSDDTVASFSSSGREGSRGPDLVAPGVSLPSLRVPGSRLDAAHGGSGGLGSRFLKGSGTSQAAAVVAGAAALVIQERPAITPGQLKASLQARATALAGEPTFAQGRGLLNLWSLFARPASAAGPQPVASTGAGSLDAARGSRRPALAGIALSGERDVMGRPIDSRGLARARSNGSTWTGSTWNGSTWTGSTWTGSSWTGSTWTGSTWTGSTWTGSTWTGSTWTGSTWNSSNWSSHGWEVIPLRG